MTTIDTSQDAATATDHPPAGLVVAIADWVTSTDHKKIGRLFVGFALLELLIGAILGLLLSLERATGGSTMLESNALLQLFQSYRVGIVLFVAAPLALGLGIAVAPLQVGARTMAFPRVALFGFYLWLGGVGVTVASLLANGGIGGGNTDMIDFFLIGVGLVLIGLIAAAIALGTSVMATRAPGMRLGRVPIFAWSSLVGAVASLLALPVALGMVVYLFVDHRYAIGNSFGGSEAIESWIGWLWSTPMVLVFTVPVLGVFAELVPVTLRCPDAAPAIRRASVALIGVVGLAALTQQRDFPLTFGGDQGFGTFVKHLVIYGLFIGLPLLGLAGSGIASLGTIRAGLRQGRPALNAPFTFGLFSLLLIIGGFVATALLSITNLELRGTSFEEGAVLLAVYGIALAAMGGSIFWAPKLSGRVVPAGKVLPIALLTLIGGALAGASMLVAGALGQAGGTPENDASVAMLLDVSGSEQLWNFLALAGHGLVAVGVLGFVGAMMSTKIPADREIPENPYGGLTVEWTTASPAPEHNFEHVPAVSSAVPAYRPNATITVEGSDS